MAKKKCVQSKDGVKRAGESPASRNVPKKDAVTKLTREEQETLVRTAASDHEWDFWTADPKFVRRLEKLGYEPVRDHQYGWSCRVPLDRLKVLPRQKRKATGRPFRSKSCATGRAPEHQNIGAIS
jgi:hypothetical protein